MFTLNDGEQNDDYEEEESDVEHDTVYFIVITIWWLDFVTNTTTCSNAFIKMEYETLKKVYLSTIVVYYLCNLPLTCHDIFYQPPHLPLVRRTF